MIGRYSIAEVGTGVLSANGSQWKCGSASKNTRISLRAQITTDTLYIGGIAVQAM